MKNIFDIVTDQQYGTLEWIRDNPQMPDSSKAIEDPVKNAHIKSLRDLKLVTAYTIDDEYAVGFEITLLGHDALEYHDEQVRETKKRKKRENIQFWVPLFSHFMLSFAAITISIIALYLENN